MVIRVVQLGTDRLADEGTRIGTVRRPPRGVPKTAFAAQNWYDVWFPNLSPSAETMKLGQAASTPTQWTAFVRKYRAEMAQPEASHSLALLAALSHENNFSVVATATTSRTVTAPSCERCCLKRGLCWFDGKLAQLDQLSLRCSAKNANVRSRASCAAGAL